MSKFLCSSVISDHSRLNMTIEQTLQLKLSQDRQRGEEGEETSYIKSLPIAVNPVGLNRQSVRQTGRKGEEVKLYLLTIQRNKIK